MLPLLEAGCGAGSGIPPMAGPSVFSQANVRQNLPPSALHQIRPLAWQDAESWIHGQRYDLVLMSDAAGMFFIYVPSNNQTWQWLQWSILHFWRIFPLKPRLIGDFPLP